MAKRFNAKEIGERALRKIGAYSINDAEADPEELQETLYWMDMNLAHICGTEAAFWLRPATISKALTADTGSYVLETLLGTDYPSDGIVSVPGVWITTGSDDDPLEQLRRVDYENIQNKAATGRPEYFYIDRLASDDEQKVYFYPVPSSGYTAKFLVQTYSPDLTKRPFAEQHGLYTAAQLWLTLSTAFLISDGPVRRLEAGRMDRIEKQAMQAFKDLKAYGSVNTEQVRDRRVQAWGP